MHIKQAIDQQVDIICQNIEERYKCVEILEREGTPSCIIGVTNGLSIALCQTGQYYIKDIDSHSRHIPAAEFIASNTEQVEVGSLYTPAEIEYVDKVAMSIAAHVYGASSQSNDMMAIECYDFALDMLEQRRLLTGKTK